MDRFLPKSLKGDYIRRIENEIARESCFVIETEYIYTNFINNSVTEFSGLLGYNIQR